jgi:hypothetical protein
MKRNGKMEKKLHFSHGEVNIFEASGIPKGARKLTVREKHYVVAHSETTGNDHRIDVTEDMEIYELNGVIYVKSDSPVRVYCPNPARHGVEEIPARTWEFDVAGQADHLTEELRNVTD